MRPGAWLLLILVGSACVFDDAIPPQVVVWCASNAECPRGWRCSTLRGRCTLVDETDTVGPTLTGTVSPPLVRPGEAVVVTVQADEPVSGAPVVELRTGTTSRPIDATDAGTWVYVVPGDASDELLTFYASAEDLPGNGTQGARLGTSLVDGTPPEITSVRVTPQTVAPGQATLVTILVSEEVRAGATLAASTATGAVLVQASAPGSTSTLRFELLVPAGAGDQALSLALTGLVDAAGNPGADATVGMLAVDGTAPVISGLNLGGSRYSAQPGFNTISVPVSVAGASAISVCLDQTCQSGTSGQAVTFPISGQETEGPYTVSVRASDEVGNQAQAAEVVVLDLSPPRALSLRVAPAVIPPGGTVSVTAAFNELLAADAELSVSSSTGAWSTRVLAAAAGTNLATFDVQLPPASLPSGTFHLEISGITDDVANAASALDAGVFRLDVDPPVFLPSDAGYARRYSLQPGHDLISLPTPPVDGATAVEVCLGSTCQRFDGGVVGFAVAPDAGEGNHALVYRAFDEVGNVATRFDVVTFDFTPPSVLSSEVRYAPPPGCPLIAVDAITAGTGVTLSLATDEPLAAAPRPDAGAVFLALASADDAGRSFAFAGSAPDAGLSSGLLEVTAVLADDVGNTALRRLGQLEIDVSLPLAPGSAASGLFIYRRIPFGSQDTSYQPRFTVSADAGVFEPELQVQLWSAPSAGLLMGTLRSDSTGALPLTTLPPVDLPKLYFEAFDSACNAPIGGRRPVPGMEVTATLGSKVIGAAVPNPHRFLEEYVADQDSMTLTPSREWGDSEVGRTGGGVALTASPTLSWQSAGPTPSTIRCAWQDPASGKLYVLGDNAYRRDSVGLVDLGPLPGPVTNNCLTTNLTGGASQFTASSTPGNVLTSYNGEFFLSPLYTYYYYYYGPQQLGWIAANPYASLLFAMPNEGGSTAVWTRDYMYEWFEVYVTSAPSPRPLGRQNFTQYGAGYPLLVGSATGGRETWALEPGYDYNNFEWTRLNDAPDTPEAVQHFGGNVLMVGAANHHAWTLLSDGAWLRVADCPLQRPIIASFEGPNESAAFVGDDLSVVAYSGSTWWWLAPAVPALGGYRAQGHSLAQATLTPSGPDAGLLLFASNPDGGPHATWSWGSAGWSRLSAAAPALTGGVAGLHSDGTVYMLGRHTAPDAGMLTVQFAGGEWVIRAVGSPTARVDHSLGPYISDGLMVVGGSTITSTPQTVGDLHRFTGSTWVPTGDALPSRSRAAVARDRRRQATVVFGGARQVPLQDTWEHRSGMWTQVASTTSPSARAGASLTWDPRRELLVLTGGAATSDTWLYDGAWRDMTRWMGAPPQSSLAAWDSTTGSIVSLGVAGDALLAPTGRTPAHRFIASLPTPSSTTVSSGQVRVDATASGGAVSMKVWNGREWLHVGNATSALTSLTPLQLQYALGNGLRIQPVAVTPAQLRTDYVELVVRYVVAN